MTNGWYKEYLASEAKLLTPEDLPDYRKNGVQITSSAGNAKVTFKNVIDVSSLTKDDELLSVAPLTASRGTTSFTDFDIVLTDADDPDNYVRCVISIDCPFIEKLRALMSDSTALDFLDRAGEDLPVKVRLGKEEHEKFLMHVKEYLRLEQAKEQLLLISKLFELLAFIKYAFQDREGMKVPESNPELWSEKAMYCIERNFSVYQTADVAKALNVNENYLSRVFKSETGISLNNYIIQRKIAEAKKLLYNGASVKDACTSSGFNDCSNFIRTFKKFTGVSPGTIKNPPHREAKR